MAWASWPLWRTCHGSLRSVRAARPRSSHLFPACFRSTIWRHKFDSVTKKRREGGREQTREQARERGRERSSEQGGGQAEIETKITSVFLNVAPLSTFCSPLNDVYHERSSCCYWSCFCSCLSSSSLFNRCSFLCADADGMCDLRIPAALSQDFELRLCGELSFDIDTFTGIVQR